MIIKKTFTTAILSAAIIIAGFSLIPSPAYAIDFNPFNPIDPFCLFSCDNEPDVQNNTYTNTNSNNVITNSYNENSPVYGSTAVSTGGTAYVAAPAEVYHSTPSVVYQSTPSTVYQTPAPAAVTQTQTQTTNVNVSASTPSQVYQPAPVYSYNYPPTYYPPTNYQQTPSVVYQPTPTYVYQYPLTVACSANTTFAPIGTTVTWSAYTTGGSGNSSYSWSGTDGIYGSGSSMSAYYSTPGVKYNYVTVYSNGQSTSARCSNAVTVGAPVVNPTYIYPIAYNTMQVGCAADTTTARIGSPITWHAEATGSTGRFIYSWSGTDNLFGTQSSAITNYAKPGVKSAIVTVTSTSGQSISRVCTNTVTVKSPVVAKKAPVKVAAAPAPAPQVVYVEPAPLATNPATAASLFSLNNVPWGLVATLIILVLLGMVIYLFVNRNKI